MFQSDLNQSKKPPVSHIFICSLTSIRLNTYFYLYCHSGWSWGKCVFLSSSQEIWTASATGPDRQCAALHGMRARGHSSLSVWVNTPTVIKPLCTQIGSHMGWLSRLTRAQRRRLLPCWLLLYLLSVVRLYVWSRYSWTDEETRKCSGESGILQVCCVRHSNNMNLVRGFINL